VGRGDDNEGENLLGGDGTRNNDGGTCGGSDAADGNSTGTVTVLTLQYPYVLAFAVIFYVVWQIVMNRGLLCAAAPGTPGTVTVFRPATLFFHFTAAFTHTVAAAIGARSFVGFRRSHMGTCRGLFRRLKSHEAVLLATVVINAIGASADYLTFASLSPSWSLDVVVCRDAWRVHTASAQWGAVVVTFPLMAYLSVAAVNDTAERGDRALPRRDAWTVALVTVCAFFYFGMTCATTAPAGWGCVAVAVAAWLGVCPLQWEAFTWVPWARPCRPSLEDVTDRQLQQQEQVLHTGGERSPRGSKKKDSKSAPGDAAAVLPGVVDVEGGMGGGFARASRGSGSVKAHDGAAPLVEGAGLQDALAICTSAGGIEDRRKNRRSASSHKSRANSIIVPLSQKTSRGLGKANVVAAAEAAAAGVAAAGEGEAAARARAVPLQMSHDSDLSKMARNAAGVGQWVKGLFGVCDDDDDGLDFAWPLQFLVAVFMPLVAVVHVLSLPAVGVIDSVDGASGAFALLFVAGKLVFLEALVSHTNDMERRIEAQELANAGATEARRTFLRYVFHEIRVPLNTVSMGLAIVTDDAEQLTESSQEALKMMSSSVNFMSDCLNDVLSISKIEDGNLELVKQPFLLDDLLGEVTQAVQVMNTTL